MSLQSPRRAALAGRGTECARLDQLLAEARLGNSAALVLRGEAGIGKSALLEYAVGRSEGYVVLRAIGVEWEMELPSLGSISCAWDCWMEPDDCRRVRARRWLRRLACARAPSRTAFSSRSRH